MTNIRLSPIGRSGTSLAFAFVAAAIIPSAGLSAQETDSRWLPWLGCWDAVAEDAPMVCFLSGTEGEGVEIVTIIDGDVASRETILADGLNQSVSREGCEGWERTEFSDDRQRVYFQSELLCGENVSTRATGLMAMQTPFEWIDIKSMVVDGESAPFVMRYLLASAPAVEAAGMSDITAGMERKIQAARYRASRPATIENVLEVSLRMDPAAVEAWLAELNQEFEVNAESLVEMADAGVPESVIDLMVAISFPDEFAIDRGPNGRGVNGLAGDDVAYGQSQYGSASSYYGRYYNDPFFLGRYYSPFYGYRYSPFGYGPIYGYGGFGVYSPTVVVVDRRGDDEGTTRRRGRVVNGRGYSSGGRSRGSSSASSGRSRGSSAAGSSARRGSTSSGSSRSSGGRKAKRRGGRF
jgi:hypothetical protein